MSRRLVALASAAALCLLLAPAGRLRADVGHEVTIADLTLQIAGTPDIPELYFQRAWNLRELRKNDEARADFEKTLTLKPGFLPAQRELARLDAMDGHAEAAITRLRRVIAEAPASEPLPVAGCCSLLADTLLKAGQNDEALAAARQGLALSPSLSLDLCLTESEALRRLRRYDERVEALAAAAGKLRSFVLRIAWLEALIDAGRGAEALPDVEKELASTRWRSSWLIRRARIRLAAGESEAALTDLREARAEIESRLKPEHPDLSLVCDHGVTLALLGDRAAAAAELARARAGGADDWMTRLLADLVDPQK